MQMKMFDDRYNQKYFNTESTFIPYMHYDNLMGKIKLNYKNIGKEINIFFNNIYMKYRKELESLDYASKDMEVFKIAANLINQYLNEIDSFSLKYEILSQSKFRSSFLEELNIYLFKDLIQNSSFKIYNKNIYAGMTFDNETHIKLIFKDVDFCIGREVKIRIDNDKPISIIIPIICVEVKTYLDATMFGEVQYSNKQIKNASCNVKTYVLMENNEVSEDKIAIAKYDNSLDEMFVLRNGFRKKKGKISYQALFEYYNEISMVIEKNIYRKNINIQSNNNVGRLFN